MSENDKRMEQLDKVVDIVEELLAFYNQNQKGQTLEILTSDQMLRRLLICLDQLKAGNNSEKFKNKIRQLLYS